ncbi:MAG: hypothetical protein H0U75_05295 [Legionella sp.]|nr:hypothetical protein [Legionella sp.]
MKIKSESSLKDLFFSIKTPPLKPKSDEATKKNITTVVKYISNLRDNLNYLMGWDNPQEFSKRLNILKQYNQKGKILNHDGNQVDQECPIYHDFLELNIIFNNIISELNAYILQHADFTNIEALINKLIDKIKTSKIFEFDLEELKPSPKNVHFMFELEEKPEVITPIELKSTFWSRIINLFKELCDFFSGLISSKETQNRHEIRTEKKNPILIKEQPDYNQNEYLMYFESICTRYSKAVCAPNEYKTSSMINP